MERALSGIQSSGKLTLGNYIGAIKQFTRLQDNYELFVFVANLHAITTNQSKKDMQNNTIDLVAFYLAAGLDYHKTTIFLQSDVMAHTQLGWILQCQTYLGELNRMTQFKDKSANQNENISAGLYTYPSLMAADILLYDASCVPVGDDQVQHLELTRTLANRFNNLYGETFVVPQPLINKEGARIMSLVNPLKKMSKSDPAGDKACIYLLDEPKAITKKIKSATTDNIGIVQYDVINQPGISNLITIYAQLEDTTIEKVSLYFKDYNYANFKEEVALCVVKHLSILQEKYQTIIKENLVAQALTIGQERAEKVAYKKIMKVKNKMGLNLKK